MVNNQNKLFVLPGFSLKNKVWTIEATTRLRAFNPQIIEWEHWKIGKTSDNWIEKEIEKIDKEIGSGRVNILAKSIGTLIAVKVLQGKTNLINKLILCGIPVVDFEPGDEKYYEILKYFDPNKVLTIQNENDNHGSFKEVQKLIGQINSKIKILSKPSDKHEYPYWDDFSEFLLN